MINIDPALKTIYRNDRFPMSSIAHPKDMEAYFAGLDLTILGDQFAEDKGGFELSEGICRDSDLKFGKCNAAQVKFTVADVSDDIAGKEFGLKQIVDGTYEMPFGYYTVETCPKQDDLRFKDITAYDRMKKTNIDVAAWYNGLTLPMTLGAFRSSLLAYFGLAEDTSNLPLPNDSMPVEKTILPAQLPGQEMIEKIEELNGVFGVINPEGKFSHVILKPGYGDYPTNDYPQNDYPISANDTSYVQPNLIDETITIPMRETIRFEEYTVQEIDKLIIRGEEDDIGAIVGTGTNAYVIEGNYLVYGKSAAQLQAIATNAYGYMAKRPYRPYNSRGIGLPYVKPGDMLKFDQDEPVTGYVLSRTLTGAQGLMDEFTSKGNQQRKQNTSQNVEITKLKYRTAKLKVDIDGVLIEVADLEAATSAAISVLSDNINLKVDKNGVVAAINISPETVKIQANNIALEGIITANGRFKINLDGSMEATNGKFSGELVAATGTFTGVLNGNTIIAPTVSGGTVNGARIVSQLGSDSTIIENGGIKTSNITMASGSLSSSHAIGGTGYSDSSSGKYVVTSSNGVQMTQGGVINVRIWPDGEGRFKYVYCNLLNDFAPITSGNIAAQSVRALKEAVYVSAENNFRPYVSGASSCGTDLGKFSSVWAVNGTIQTSDERRKTNIRPLEEDRRFMKFAMMVVPYMYQMIDGTSGRYHAGFIAQRIEKAMELCGISSMEFAGLIKAPVYAKKILDDEGNETNEYDTESEIIDYDYNIRYDEFIPLIFLWLRSLENR